MIFIYIYVVVHSFLEKTYVPWFLYDRKNQLISKQIHSSIVFSTICVLTLIFTIKMYNPDMSIFIPENDLFAIFYFVSIIIIMTFIDVKICYRSYIYEKNLDKFNKASDILIIFINIMALLFILLPVILFFLLPEKIKNY